MIPVDLHSHTLFSNCGLHTVVELLTAAREKGMAALAVTDHGPALNGRLNSPFFERLKDPVEGITLLKGIESNILDREGRIDIPERYIRYCDVVLAGLHPVAGVQRNAGDYTEMVERALAHNPCIDIISHPNDAVFPVDYRRLARSAQACGAALECNNSKVRLQRVPIEETRALLLACKEVGCRVAVNSDAHALHEVGCDDDIMPLIREVGIADTAIVNRSKDSTFAFIEERRSRKTTAGSKTRVRPAA